MLNIAMVMWSHDLSDHAQLNVLTQLPAIHTITYEITAVCVQGWDMWTEVVVYIVYMYIPARKGRCVCTGLDGCVCVYLKQH